jgi:hypothetical protein
VQIHRNTLVILDRVADTAEQMLASCLVSSYHEWQ